MGFVRIISRMLSSREVSRNEGMEELGRVNDFLVIIFSAGYLLCYMGIFI